MIAVLMATCATGLRFILAIDLLISLLAMTVQFGGHSVRPRVMALSFAALAVVCFQSMCVVRACEPSLCFERGTVTSIRGKVVYDSSFSQKGNCILKLYLEGCGSVYGDEGSSKGMVVAVGQTKAIVTSGVEVVLEGEFTEDVFIYNRINVLGRSRFNDLRERVICFLEDRLLGDSEEPASTLAVMLLLGRSEDRYMPLRELAAECGCSHVLALSGMHLGLLVAICSLLFRRGWLSKVLSCLLVFVFVLIAGPRPSLVRAALAFALAFVPEKTRTIVCFSVQLLLFPLSMVELGCCYGYVAILALSVFSPYLQAALSQVFEGFGKFFCATFSVLVLSVPVQLLSNGYWCPIAVLIAPIVALLASLSMVDGLLMVVFGRLGFLVEAGKLIYRGFEQTLTYCADFPKAGWLGYCLLLLVATLPFALNIVRRHLLYSRLQTKSGAIDLKSVPNVNFKQ